MTWAVAAVLAALATAWLAWRGLGWWEERARSDPSRDPGARRVTTTHRTALASALDRERPDEAVAAALAASRVTPDLHWRTGLRRVLDRLPALPADADGDALRAEVHLALGEVPRARDLVRDLPADHWRACLVRAGLYVLDKDAERADHAFVAALLLAPRPEQPDLVDRLTEHRRRHPRGRSRHLALWDRPPR